MRNLNWKDVNTKYPLSMSVLISWLPQANLLNSGTLLYGGTNSHYHYRFLPDFFDMFDIEWTVETESRQSFVGNVADYENEHFATQHCETRIDAELFCVDEAFAYLEDKLRKKVN